MLSRVINEVADRVTSAKMKTQLQSMATQLHNEGAHGLIG